jgi:WD domain, G-beta repeat
MTLLQGVTLIVAVAGGTFVAGADDEPLPKGAVARWWSPGLASAGPVGALAISADGKRGASGSKDGTVRLWAADSGRELRILPSHEGEVKAVVFSPDGKWIASAGADKLIRLSETTSGKIQRVFRGHVDCIEALAFTPDGATLISAGQDEAIILWDAHTGQMTQRLMNHRRGVRCLAVTRDGKTFASGGEDRTIYLWDLPGCQEQRFFRRPGWVFSLSFSGDGRSMASGGLDQTVHIHKLEANNGYDNMGGYERPVRSLALSRDGKAVAAGNEDGRIRLWEVISREVRREFAGHAGGVRAIALFRDETRLLSGGEDGKILVWELAGAAATKPRAALEPALQEKEWQAAWHALGAGAEESYHAMEQFRADPDSWLKFLDARLEPLFTMKQRLTALLVELESERFNVRQKVTEEMEKLGELTIPFLEEKLQEQLTLETKRRIERVITRVTPADPEAPSMFLRLWRAIEILEALATPPARATLLRMSRETPDARIRREAEAALARLKGIDGKTNNNLK